MIPARKQTPAAMVGQLCQYLLEGSGLLCSCLQVLFSHSFTHSFIHACMHQRLWWLNSGSETCWASPPPLSSTTRPPFTLHFKVAQAVLGTQADFDLIILLPQPSDYLGLQDYDTRSGFKLHFLDSDCLFLSYRDEQACLKYN